MKYLVVILFLLTSAFSKSNEKFEIIQPQTKTVYKEAFASVVIKLSKNTQAKIIQLQSGSNKYIIKIKKNKRIYCKTIKLNEGNNQYEVKVFDKNKSISEERLELFYHSEVFEKAVEVPKGYTSPFFHNNKSEKLCSKCHNMNTDNKERPEQWGEKLANDKNIYDSVLVNVEESNCFQCHKSLLSRKNSHAPSANFLCMKCHTGELSNFNDEVIKKSRFLVPDPIDEKCFSCHETKQKENWYKKESKHGPVMTGRCTKCHNPHSSDNMFFLKKPIWNLCTTCHDEKAKGKHVLSSFVYGRNKGAHPTKGRPDPSRSGRELVCSGCHNPHGSDSIYLLRMKGKSTYGVCKRCHDK